MKTILIATDFSAAARNAGIYGMELAKAFNTKVILINAYQELPIPISTSLDIVTAEDMRRMVLEKLEAEALYLGLGTEIPIETVCGDGSASYVIHNAVRRTKAEMIILGMKGNRKDRHKFFGSTVTTLVGNTRVPLLVIPEETNYADPLTIALADDIRPDANNHILDMLLALTQKFHSRLYIVRIITDRSMTTAETHNMPAQLKIMLRTLDPIYEFPEDNDIVHGLKEFVSSRRVDMLVMIPHRHSLLERWFAERNTRSMVFEAPVPLLILPDTKQKTIDIPLADPLGQDHQ